MKAFKAFIKPFEGTIKKFENKKLICFFFSSSGIGWEGIIVDPGISVTEKLHLKQLVICRKTWNLLLKFWEKVN